MREGMTKMLQQLDAPAPGESPLERMVGVRRQDDIETVMQQMAARSQQGNAESENADALRIMDRCIETLLIGLYQY